MLAIIGQLIAPLLAFFSKWYEERKRRKTAEGLQAVGDYLTLLDSMKALGFVDRVMLFVGHNGGGLPKAGEEYTVRAYYGWALNGSNPVSRYRAPLIIDGHYCNMLCDMVQRGHVVNTTADMDVLSNLRGYYQAEGVVQSVAVFLTVFGNNLYYVSVANFSRPFTTPELSEIGRITNQLRGIIHGNRNGSV